MANEIRFRADLRVVNGNLDVRQQKDKQSDQTTAGAVSRTQTIPTSDTVISLTGVTAARAVFIENTDATNYIDIGPTSGGAIVPLSRLYPGEVALFPLTPGVVLRGQANTASVVMNYMLVET